ncbi:MAB_1171c family putative transporter [Streptomyces sp. NPDC059003]|uniref:MAB_1171c family putative transporter n=1 Tax=Streptomyces sp. NPDC059003 TaxID=3346691 RepID=UPI0036745864
MNSTVYYVAAIALATALAVKVPAMVRAWHEVRVRCVFLVMALAASGFVSAAPPSAAAVNDLTGIPNFAGPLVYCLMTAFSASCTVLLVHWRGGHPRQVRRTARNWIAAYSTIALTLIGLFSLGDAPVERVRDLDTYYANTPFIREMIVLYLLAHAVAAIAMATLCWRWLHDMGGWLRAVLLCQVGAAAGLLAFDLAKLTAVAARWMGQNWDDLSTSVAPPFASASSVISAIGYTLPLAGPHLSRAHCHWTQYRALAPLWHEVRPKDASRCDAQRTLWWAPPSVWLTERETSIGDELLRLSRYRDTDLRTAALRRALAAGSPHAEAEAIADAADIAQAAVTASAQVAARPEDQPGAPETAEPSTTITPRPCQDLVKIAHALASSPIVDAAREQAREDAVRQQPT